MTISTVYRIKLTDFELRVLIGVLAEYRHKLIAAGEDTTDVNDLILHILDVYDGIVT